MTARTALYRYFDAEGSLLYVGIAFDPDSRGHQHARTASDTWWKLAAKRTDEWFDARADAERAEIEAIVSEQPRFNVKDNPRSTEDVQRVRRLRAAKTERLPRDGSGKYYMRVAELVRRKIHSGDLPPGAKVPRQSYAAEFGVTAETVKRACEALADAGLLDRGHGHRVPVGPPVEYGYIRLPLDGRPEEAAATLRAAMTDEQVAAVVAALQPASAKAA